MNGSRKPNRPMPTGAKNEEGRPQGQPSSEHCSAEACDRLKSRRARGGVTGELKMSRWQTKRNSCRAEAIAII